MTSRDRAALAVCALAVLGLLTRAPVARAGASAPLEGLTVLIDAGHGGFQLGAIALGMEEKTLTLPIALDLGASLQRAGARVVYTRTTDDAVSLQARSALANGTSADAFVAVHANSAPDPSIRGATTFYGAPGGYVDGVTRPHALVQSSRRLAEDVQRSVAGSTHEVDRGAQSSAAYVLGHSEMPAILIETGFMTNPDEGRRLATSAFQDQIARAIASGVVDFLGTTAATTVREASVASAPTAGSAVASPARTPAVGARAALGPTGAPVREHANPFAAPSRTSLAVAFGAGVLALPLMVRRHLRLSARRRRRMAQRRRLRRHVVDDPGG